MKQWKRTNLKEAHAEIIELSKSGHVVRMLTAYHWRIDGIDVWPSTKKYLLLATNTVVTYDHLKDIIQQQHVQPRRGMRILWHKMLSRSLRTPSPLSQKHP